MLIVFSTDRIVDATDIEHTGDGNTVLTALAKNTDGETLQINSHTVEILVRGECGEVDTRFVGGRFEAVVGSGGNFCIVKHNNKVLK
ncbi:hypothetical protein [Bacteroides rodentium]